MRDFAAQKILAKRPEALALYARVAKEPAFEVRAAAGAKPAEILLYDEIGFWGVTGKDFVKALADAGAGPVTLRINSPGGDVFDGMAIHNAIKQRGGVTAVVDGIAASAASFIMEAADSVAMQETAMVMVHRAWGLTIGNGPDHLDAAAVLEKIDGQLAAIYAAKSGKSADDMLAMMDAETWLTSSEAVAAGLADEVLKQGAQTAKRATIRAALRAAFDPDGDGDDDAAEAIAAILAAQDSLNDALASLTGAPDEDDAEAMAKRRATLARRLRLAEAA